MLVFADTIGSQTDKKTGCIYITATACRGCVTEQDNRGLFNRRAVIGSYTVIGRSKDKKVVRDTIKKLKANAQDNLVCIAGNEKLCIEAGKALFNSDLMYRVDVDIEDSIAEEIKLREELTQKNLEARKQYA